MVPADGVEILRVLGSWMNWQKGFASWKKKCNPLPREYDVFCHRLIYSSRLGFRSNSTLYSLPGSVAIPCNSPSLHLATERIERTLNS